MSGTLRRSLVKPPARRNGPEFAATHLGKALTIRGVLDTDGEVHVHGQFLGNIHADRLVVGTFGYVEGDVVARDVRVEGRLKGRIFAFQVVLDSSADMEGRIFHHTVTIEKGARFEGRMPWRPLNYFEAFDKPPEMQP